MKTLERVARAMAERNDDPDAWPIYMDDAKAALTALLEPSEAMMVEGNDVTLGAMRQLLDGKLQDPLAMAPEVFQAMIQQALKEGEEG